jgi:hypothetical protein
VLRFFTMWEDMLLAYNFWAPKQALISATYTSLLLSKILAAAMDFAEFLGKNLPGLQGYT